MNKRIEIVSDNEVRIQRRDPCRPPGTILAVLVNGCLNIVQDGWFDAEGRDALIEALQCLKATGSFAALADTSAVPYVGKWVRLSGYPEGSQWQILGRDSADDWHLVNKEVDPAFQGSTSRFLPLTPPAPRVRPLTPVEAAAHLGREFRCPEHSLAFELVGVVKDAVIYVEDGDKLQLQLVLSSLKYCTWADDGSPCGFVEPT